MGSLRPCTSSDASPTMVGSAVRKCEGMCSSYQYCSLYGMLPKSNYLPEHCFAPCSAARFYPLQARISLNSQTHPAVAGLRQCELSSCLSADRSERSFSPSGLPKNARSRDSRKVLPAVGFRRRCFSIPQQAGLASGIPSKKTI